MLARAHTSLAALAALVAAFLLGGCGFMGTTMGIGGTPLRVVARGASPARPWLVQRPLVPDLPGAPTTVLRLQPGPDFPLWASETLAVRVETPFRQDANSRIEAKYLARLDVRQKVMVELARRVKALSAPDLSRLDGVFERNHPRASQLEKLVRASAVLSDVEELSDKVYQVRAELELEPIALLLWGEPVEEQLPEGPPGRQLRRYFGWPAKAPEPPEDVLGRQAFHHAVANARKQLLDKVRAAPLYPGTATGQLTRADPGSDQLVRQTIAQARVESAWYPQPGVCEARLSIDLGKLQKQLRQGSEQRLQP